LQGGAYRIDSGLDRSTRSSAASRFVHGERAIGTVGGVKDEDRDTQFMKSALAGSVLESRPRAAITRRFTAVMPAIESESLSDGSSW